MFEDLETPIRTSAAAKPAVGNYTCHRCRGTGRYTYRNGQCFPCGKCRSTGRLKTSPEQRIKARAYSATSAIKRREENVAEFGQREPAALEWLKSATGDFPASLLEQVGKRGDLSRKQLQRVYECIARKEDWDKQREQKATQTQINMGDLLHRFDLAVKAGKKRPRINVGDLLFSLAPAHGKNAGHVYVKGPKDDWDERPYLGKITPEGKFYAGRGVEDDTKDRIASIGADVVSAAKAHGSQHGQCCFCNAPLSTDESVSNGYGPICADNWGLPWIVREEFIEAKAKLKQANQEAAQ